MLSAEGALMLSKIMPERRKDLPGESGVLDDTA